MPRSNKPLRLKDDGAPRFRAGDDELAMVADPHKEKGGKALDSEDEEPHPCTPSLRERLQKEARSQQRQLFHFPKSGYCEICRRAKMARRAHRRRDAAVDADETPPLRYGHRLRVDHQRKFRSETSDNMES